MPIFEYTCQDCGDEFELLIRGSKVAACPGCKSKNLEKKFSPQAVHGDGSHGKAMRAAKKRDQSKGYERMQEQRVYEESHDRHGH